jgi:hypothetical protein
MRKKVLAVLPLLGIILIFFREIFFPSSFSVPIFYLLLLETVFLPGFILAFISFRHHNLSIPEWVATSASLGLAAQLPPYLLAYIFKIPLGDFLPYLLALISFPSALICSLIITKAKFSFRIPQKSHAPIQRKAWNVLWLLTAVTVIAVFFLLGYQDYSSDFYVELATISRYTLGPHFYNFLPHLEGRYVDGAHTFIITSLFEALLTKASGLRPFETIFYLQPFLNLIAIYALIFFFNSIFKNRNLVIFNLLLSLAYFAIIAGPLNYWLGPCPETVISIHILLPASFAMALRYLEGKGRVYFWWAVLLGSSLFLFSMTGCAFFFFGMMFFGVWQIISNYKDKKTIKSLLFIGLGGALTTLPLILLRLSHPAMNDTFINYKYYTHRIIEMSWGMFYMNPLDTVYHNQPLLIALILSPFLLVFRNDRWAIFLFSTIVIPNFIRYIPPLTTAMSYFMTYLFVHKLGGISYYIPILGLFLYLLVYQMEKRKETKGGWIPLLRQKFSYILGVLLILIITGALIRFIIDSPQFRAGLRAVFVSSDLQAVWDHKHLLFVILPILIWVVIGSLLELKNNFFSTKIKSCFSEGIRSYSPSALVLASLLAMMVFLYAVPAAFLQRYKETGSCVAKIEERLGPRPGMSFLAKKVGSWQTVLSDPYTSWALPAYCPQYVFVVYGRRGGSLHKPGGNFDLDQRLAFCDEILDPDKDLEEDQCQELITSDISFIYLNFEKVSPKLLDKFAARQEYLRLLFESEKDAVIEVIPAREISFYGRKK